MFNAPRRMPGPLSSSTSFLSSPNASSAPAYPDPLANSAPAFGDLDPWSAVPSPRAGTPQQSQQAATAAVRAGGAGGAGGDSAAGGRGGEGGRKEEGLNGLINDPPALYVSLLDQTEPNVAGEVSLAAVHRLLARSKLPAMTVEKIIHLTSHDKSTLTRQEFFCALALVAFAQSHHSPGASDISIERLSLQLSQEQIPLPSFVTRPGSPASDLGSTHSGVGSGGGGVGIASGSVVGRYDDHAPSGFNAWDTAPRTNGHGPSGLGASSSHPHAGDGYSANGSTFREGVVGASDQAGYWKKLEKVEVELVPEKEGWFLQKYRVESDRRGAGPVSRRYSDFVWLHDVLTKRYPFRLLPALPPKRLSPDTAFLESRRKALRRFLSFTTNHPVISTDGALNVFLTEPSFESWRKRTTVSTDEESLSKKLTTAQEMSIPSDLEEKLGNVRDHLPAVLGHYQRLVVLAERACARVVAQAGDASRVAMAVQSVGELVPRCCFRAAGAAGEAGGGCSLCEGVGRGFGEVGESWARIAEENEKRAQVLLNNHIEALKSQRDLYLAFRDLFIRHDKLSRDNVDALRKKVEGRAKKGAALKAAAKVGWEVEVDKLVAASDQDTATIQSLLARRVFIRECMWHELAVVHHSRQAAQATLGWRAWARDQREAMGKLEAVWEGLEERLDGMPLE
ncbi:hypothetical protein IAT38_003561 [Cryptococcus sp. DSM 104549]